MTRRLPGGSIGSAALKNTVFLDLVLGMWGWPRPGLQSYVDSGPLCILNKVPNRPSLSFYAWEKKKLHT